MISGIITLVVSAIKPLAEWRKAKRDAKKGEEGTVQTSDAVNIIIKTLGLWGIIAMLLYAMSKGILTLNQVEGLIETIKE